MRNQTGAASSKKPGVQWGGSGRTWRAGQDMARRFRPADWLEPAIRNRRARWAIALGGDGRLPSGARRPNTATPRGDGRAGARGRPMRRVSPLERKENRECLGTKAGEPFSCGRGRILAGCFRAMLRRRERGLGASSCPGAGVKG